MAAKRKTRASAHRKLISEYSPAELDAAISEAEKVPAFWIIMKGVDAYLERRRRRTRRARELSHERLRRVLDDEMGRERSWGDS